MASGAVKPFFVSRDSHEAAPLGSASCSHACHCGSSSASGVKLSGDSSGDGRPALMVVRLSTLKSLGSFAFADASIACHVGHASSAVIVSSAADPGATRETASLTASGKPGKSHGPSSVMACDAVSYRRCHSAPSPLESPARERADAAAHRHCVARITELLRRRTCHDELERVRIPASEVEGADPEFARRRIIRLVELDFAESDFVGWARCVGGRDLPLSARWEATRDVAHSATGETLAAEHLGFCVSGYSLKWPE